MKLLELEINNFRGIKELKITPNGKNFLISGPNGSGKSAVVDAVDFLLTGQVSRMSGAGTKGITLKKHAKHVDSETKDVEVRALLKLHGVDEGVEIKRVLSKPTQLIFEDKYADLLEPVLELASRGQHVLTRREILNYITADAGTRSKQITNLLKLQDIDNTRKVLVKLKNILRNEFNSAKNSLEDSEAKIKATTNTYDFTEPNVLAYVNKKREILNGTSLEVLDSNILIGLNRPSYSTDEGVNLNILDQDLQNIRDFIFQKDHWDQLMQEYKQLQETIEKGPAEQLKLSRLGLKAVDGNSCPLCDVSWEEGKLKTHIEGKIKKLEAARQDLDRAESILVELSESVKITRASLNEVVTASNSLGLVEEKDKLMVWMEELIRIINAVEEDHYPEIMIPTNVVEYLNIIKKSASQITTKPSPEEHAWDTLTRLEENLKYYHEARKNYEIYQKAYEKSKLLHDSFINSRNQVLEKLYTQIKDRFVELYQELHGPDEINFDAVLESDGAGIDFQVDFHGRGVNPPHALHSEGHQDSMGICLYLALAEQLTEGYIDLIVLDDVMMSVDAPHRRQICHLLADFFKGRQFFITTHDQTWARQLQSEGVVRSGDRIELSNWTIENGPSVNYMDDIWDPIETDLRKNDIPSAAAKLRRGSEEYFSLVCSALHAHVKFKFNGQYELGDLLSGAMSSYKRQLKQAKTVARSWENYDELERLTEIEDYSKDVFGRINMERWAVNPAVHYNQWADFTPQDFKPVVDSFQDLFGMFQCEKCGTLMHLVMDCATAEAVKCNCGSVNWNLRGK